MMDSGNNNMASNFSQLVECPRCGNRFELSETFRAQFEAEKRSEIDIALRDNEARIRAEAEKASQRSWRKALNRSRHWRRNCKPTRRHMKSAKPKSAPKRRKPARRSWRKALNRSRH